MQSFEFFTSAKKAGSVQLQVSAGGAVYLIDQFIYP